MTNLGDHYSHGHCWLELFIIGALLLAEDYDFDRPSQRGHSSQLEDIRDWNSGNKSIAEEAIDKVKEIVGRVKIFDTSSDYPYVGLLFCTFCWVT